MLYRRWESAFRNRLAGAGLKPPRAALDSDSALRRRLSHYALPDLLVLDEIGYLSYSNRHADLLFELINRRYERKSTIVLRGNDGATVAGRRSAIVRAAGSFATASMAGGCFFVICIFLRKCAIFTRVCVASNTFRRPRTTEDVWGVNVRCLDGVDFASIPVKPIHGSRLD